MDYVDEETILLLPSGTRLTASEVDELLRYLGPQYLSPNHWPALSALYDRLSAGTAK